MRVENVEACSFDSWYPTFSKLTFETQVLAIPKPVLDYLRSDGGVVLPVECDSDKLTSSSPDDWVEETAEYNQEDDSEDQDVQRPSFPEFSERVRTAIANLGGSVMPKLNWSAPRDATWVGLANSLRCTTITEVFLLLKSSEFIIHDLTQPYKDCEDESIPIKDSDTYVLVLRRWSSRLNPGSEFRCFVKNGILIGICQRDTRQYYKHICDEKDSIIRDIKTFFDEHINSRFGITLTKNACAETNLCVQNNFVFDVIRKRKDLIRLVDFNPFGPTTDSLLFDWDDLNTKVPNTEEKIEFRFIEDDAGIQPTGLRHYSIPTDFVDLATGSDPHKLMDFLQLQQQMQSNDKTTE